MITHLSTSSSIETLTELSSIQLEETPRPRPRPLPLPRLSAAFFLVSLPRPRPRGSGHDGREESSEVFGLFLLPGGRPRPLFTSWTGMAAGAGQTLDWSARTETINYKTINYQISEANKNLLRRNEITKAAACYSIHLMT